jgi:hypothetical protein
MNKILSLLTLCLTASCQTVTDPSIESIRALDVTVVMSACEAMPGRGADICRVNEGAVIDSSWKIIIPEAKRIDGGEINVFFKDIQKSYAITDSVVVIPWRDLIGSNTWSVDHAGIAQALAVVRYKDDQGIIKQVRAKGMALLVVMKDGYSPMPIDSGFSAVETRCRIQYSSSGRSAIECK